MGVITIGAGAFTVPVETTSALLYVYPSWLPIDDSRWVYQQDFEFNGGTEESAGHGMGTIEMLYHYGEISREYETDFSVRLPLYYNGWWCKLEFLDGPTHTPAWMGVIQEEDREVLGAKVVGGTTVETGSQTFRAFSPRHLLEKISVAWAFWQDGGGTSVTEWLPSMNKRDDNNQLVGNRSTNRVGSSYVFGGTSRWTNLQFLQYLLRFYPADNFGWFLSGQAGVLDLIEDSIDWNGNVTLGKAINKLIPIEMGLDWTVEPGPQGFSIKVYATTPYSYAFGSALLPVNSNLVRILTSATVSEIIKVEVERSNLNQYSRIRLVGARDVYCATPPLEPNWLEVIEEFYKLVDAGDGKENDLVRRADVFNDVYQRFSAPANWTLGQQVSVRKTLTWLPLRQGVDYSDAGVGNNNPSNVIPDYQKPNAWIFDNTGDVGKFAPVAESGMHLAVLDQEWGVMVQGSPNHVMALTHWGGATETETDPLYDYESLVATIAFEGDTRPGSIYTVIGGAGGTLTRMVPEIERWWLAPETVVGVDEGGNLQRSGANWRLLRDDSARFNLLMAGLISRYIVNRARAIVTIKRYLPAAGLVGQILTWVYGQHDSQQINAPITSVAWVNGHTIIRTGYAQSTSDLPSMRMRDPLAEALQKLRT